MTYYEYDDALYHQLDRDGRISWDQQSDSAASFDRFILRPLLDETLAALGRIEGKRALEIGCGTGPASCYLASRGLDVDGIDISPKAIAMARQQAALRGHQIRYTVADICNLPAGLGPYELIVDGHCLHYLIRDTDRRKALAAIRSTLKDDGIFVVETMVSHEGMQIGPKYRLGDDGVLWLQIVGPAECDQAMQIDDAWYLPYRRILRPAQVLDELANAGFSILHHRITQQTAPTKPHLLQVRSVRI